MFTHIPNVFVSGVSGKTFLGWLLWAESKTMQLLFCCLCLRLLWWFWNWWNLGPKHFEFVIRFCVYKRRAWLVPDKLSKHNFDHTHPKPSRCWNTWTWTHCAFFFCCCQHFLCLACTSGSGILAGSRRIFWEMKLTWNNICFCMKTIFLYYWAWGNVLSKTCFKNELTMYHSGTAEYHQTWLHSLCVYMANIFRSALAPKSLHIFKNVFVLRFCIFLSSFSIFSISPRQLGTWRVLWLSQCMNSSRQVENILAITKLTYLVLNGCYTHAQSMHIRKNMFDCNIGIKCLLLKFQVYKFTWQLNKKQYEHV